MFEDCHDTLPVWIKTLGDDFDAAPHHYFHFSVWAKVSFMKHCYQRNQPVFESTTSGFVEQSTVEVFEKQIEGLCKEMNLAFTTNLGEKLQVPDETPVGEEIGEAVVPTSEDSSTFVWYLWDEKTLVNVNFNPEEESLITVYSTEQERIKTIKAKFSNLFVRRSERRGRVHLLEAGCEGIRITELGKGGQPFCKENYENEVVKDFDFIAEQLTAKAPVGRLFILDGPPGTGKTYFIKGLLEAVTNAVFLLVPSRQIERLSDPSFSPAIRRLHQIEQVPIILILEDADHALLPRDVLNMSVISDLLNYADGIVGNIIDLRILATTNAKNMDIEPALKRKRRLGKRIHIGRLTANKAREVFARLIAGETTQREVAIPNKDGALTLAEVYNLADIALGKVEPDKEDVRKSFGFVKK